MMSQPVNPIPDALMEQLHHAAQQFHQRKVELEKAMEGSDYRHQERVSIAQASLQQAEREMEEIERQIKQLLLAGGSEETPDGRAH
jgi:hypothetical protein